MRQVLFRIPLDAEWTVAGVTLPVFGLGWLLIVWAIGLGLAYAWSTGVWRKASTTDAAVPQSAEQKKRLQQEWASFGMTFLVITGLIVLAPAIGARMAPAGVPVFGYGAMLFIGFVVGAMVASRRAVAEGLSADVVWDLTTWLFLPGILGGRLFYLIQYGDRVFGRVPPSEWFWAAVNLPEGGLVLYGGVIGGIAGFLAFCWRRKIRVLQLADIVTPSIFLGVGFGRIGCFLNGCCFGDRCDYPWAVQFPAQSGAYSALMERGYLWPGMPLTPPLHPTQLYSAFDGFLIAALCLWFTPYRRKYGEVLAVGWLIYPITRFLIELLRGDELGQLNTSLTISQLVSLLLFMAGSMFLVWLSLSNERQLVRPVCSKSDGPPPGAGLVSTREMKPA